MSSHLERLNAWHLDLAITADALEHVLMAIEEPVGLSATAYILRLRLADLVESCPFSASTPAASMPEQDFDPSDFDQIEARHD